MTNLKLEDRKNTTDKGLEELKNLMNSFNFKADVDEAVSKGSFSCVGDIGDERYVWTDKAEFIIRDGNLILNGWVDVFGYDSTSEIRFNSITKIDFSGAVEALEDVISKYNQRCINKDAEIEKFLGFCALNK